MRMLLAVAALGALTTIAEAAPWSYEELQYDDGVPLFHAYQFADGPDHFLLGYECDGEWQLDAFYVQTPERYEGKDSYVPEVPTQFIIDGGNTVEMTGTFVDRGGVLHTFYDSFEAEAAFTKVIEAITSAETSVRVKFFKTDVTFSAEGVREAIGLAANNCYVE